MYLNEIFSRMLCSVPGFNYNMGCIWILQARSLLWWPEQFNYNMGCIWIVVRHVLQHRLIRLTITWDVFELFDARGERPGHRRLTITWDVFESARQSLAMAWTMFNYNMGCIWIFHNCIPDCSSFLFNYNMGCIWICYLLPGRHDCKSLTITWDVFEFAELHQHTHDAVCLTITWDVFEWIVCQEKYKHL